MNLSITKKILFGFLIICMLAVMGNLTMLMKFGNLDTAMQSMSESQTVLLTVNRMEENLRRQKKLVQDFSEMSDSASYNRFVESAHMFNELIAFFRFQSFAADNEIRGNLNKLVSDYNDFVTRFTSVVFTPAEDRKPLKLKEMRLILEKVDRNLENLKNLLETRVDDKVKEAARATRLMSRIVFISLFLICGFTVLFCAWVARSFVGPFRRLLLGTREIGQGNFDTVIDVGDADEEIQELVDAFQEMSRKLKKYRDNLIETERLNAVNLIATSVSHEVNNPLMIISGTAEYVRTVKSGTDDDLKEKMKTIVDEVQRISIITRKLARIKQMILEDYHLEENRNATQSGLLDINKSAKDER